VHLAREIARVEEYVERFHLDVADGHYVRQLLFFPDLARAIRRQTKRPLEVHLMTEHPLDWLEPFGEAGVDGFIFCRDSLDQLGPAVAEVKRMGKYAGVSLRVEEGLERVEDSAWELLDVLTIVGTPMGVKGSTGLDPSVLPKIRGARAEIAARGASTEIEVDGGIRPHTVPQIAAAGADWIVPGSLLFGQDPHEFREWLKSC
jgi:ribulose-phosphate 3-epimerase